MTGGHAPPPRSGTLRAGGANALELLWATLALLAVALVAAVAVLSWIAVWAEAVLSGATWTATPAEMPGLLVDLAAGRPVDPIHKAVAAPWRPALIATILGLLTITGGVHTTRAWVGWQAGWRHRQRARDRQRSLVWARRRDLTAMLATPPSPGAAEPPAAGRLWVGTYDGRDVLVPRATSVMVIAPTRTGKSTRLVIPNLLRWDGPAVVTSVKRDVHDLTVHQRKQTGPVAVFDPTGATGLKSASWSPLLSSTTFPDATKTAMWLADAAAVEDRHETAKFWETLATKLLAPLLFAAANDGKTMMDVSHWVDRSAFDEVAGILARLDDEDAQAAWQAIKDLPNETRGSVLGTAMAIFRAFGSPRVREATACTPGHTNQLTLNIAKLLRENGTLYLVSPEYEQTELRPLFVALVQAVYRVAVEVSANLMQGAPLNPPLLMMLDEAGNIAPLQVLPKIAATGAGQGITLMTIWQDRAQIRNLYRESDRTLIANHTTTMWLPGSQDLDTLKLLSDLIGDQWVASTNISTAPDGGLSVSEGSERIDVAPPAFLRTLKHGTAVMLTGNTPPALVRTHAYFEQHRWRRLINPEELKRYSDMHDTAGPTTAAEWKRQNWPDAHPIPNSTTDPAARPGGRPRRGSLGRVLSAGYPPIPCNRYQRATWGPGHAAIPDQLRSDPGSWSVIELPPDLMELHGQQDADLANPDIRGRVLPRLLEKGPTELNASILTLPLLRTEWHRLDLSDVLRLAWEQSYPAVSDDVSWEHSAAARAVA